jgi:hypothetical protein
MARLGHSSVRAAMIYQHATRDRDQAIAKALGTFVRDVRNAPEKQADEPESSKNKHEKRPCGTCVARGRQEPVKRASFAVHRRLVMCIQPAIGHETREARRSQ